MSATSIISIAPLGFPWATLDPFLFCAYHLDGYPEGNAKMGPEAALLQGRNIGSDFSAQDGWSMYHGDVVPGFPRHPHRGFETITIGREGFIDHADSMGAYARFGDGDAQWMTAGNGVVHSEMFPLVNPEAPNPVELFQVWLNLPREDKTADPYFTMFWKEDMPFLDHEDEAGKSTRVMVVAGGLGDVSPNTPPPSSWAAREEANVAVWTLRMEPGAAWTLPATGAGTNRVLYFFNGSTLKVADQDVSPMHAIQLEPESDVELVNGDQVAELLMLQGRPIGEPVVQHGPFVANRAEEIQQAFQDYRRTGFGGWPWDQDGPTHPRDKGRFARHSDGRVEEP